MFLPKLAKALGSCERAIVLQQIHWLSNQPNSGKVIDGERWVWGTYEEWSRDYFMMWTPVTLKHHIRKLEKQGVLLSEQLMAHEHDQTKYYRINYAHELLSLTGMGQHVIPSKGQDIIPSKGEDVVPSNQQHVIPSKGEDVISSNGQHVVDSIYGTETSTETSTETPTEKGNVGAAPTPLIDDSEPEWWQFLGALCWVCYGHQKIDALTADQFGALKAEAKKIRDAGYSKDDLRDWFKLVWRNGWQWDKGHQRPRPDEVRSSIPVLRETAEDDAESEPPRKTGYSDYNHLLPKEGATP